MRGTMLTAVGARSSGTRQEASDETGRGAARLSQTSKDVQRQTQAQAPDPHRKRAEAVLVEDKPLSAAVRSLLSPDKIALERLFAVFASSCFWLRDCLLRAQRKEQPNRSMGESAARGAGLP